LLAALTAVAACDRRTGPTESGARAVTGLVELRLGTFVQRYDLRGDRTEDGLAPSLTPIRGARALGQGRAGSGLPCPPRRAGPDPPPLRPPRAPRSPRRPR